MTKPIVFATGELPQVAAEALQAHCALTQWPEGRAVDAETMARCLRDSDAVVVKGSKPVTAALLPETVTKLKIVANIGVGYDNIDVAACRDRGVLVTNTPDVLDETVADLVMAILLSATRRIAELDRWIRAGAWKAPATPDIFGMDLNGSTLGIIGMGRIGEAVARRAKLGFGANILYHNRSPRPAAEEKYGARLAPLDELLRNSDHVVMLAPYSPQTHHMIGAREFALMKPTATFVNAARGASIDERAIIAALKAGTLRAAALDVFEREPVAPDNPLLQMPNVTLTPHIGSATMRTRNAMALRAAENVIAALAGETPRDVVAELRGASHARDR